MKTNHPRPTRKNKPNQTQFPSRISLVWHLRFERVGSRFDGEYGRARPSTGGLACIHSEEPDAIGLGGRPAAFGDAARIGGGDVHRRGCIGRDGDIEREFAVLYPPVAADFAVDGVVACFGISETACGSRLNTDAFEAGAIGIDAGDGIEEPPPHRAEGVVVERVHTGVLEALFLGPAVPSLPYCGRAVLDAVSPAWEGILIEQAVGDVQMAGLCQRREEVAQPDEPGREVAAPLFDVVNEILRGGGALVLGQQVKVQAEQIARLRFALILPSAET